MCAFSEYLLFRHTFKRHYDDDDASCSIQRKGIAAASKECASATSVTASRLSTTLRHDSTIIYAKTTHRESLEV